MKANTMRYQMIPQRLVHIIKQEQPCRHECKEKGNIIHCREEWRLLQPFGENNVSILNKLELELPFDPAILASINFCGSGSSTESQGAWGRRQRDQLQATTEKGFVSAEKREGCPGSVPKCALPHHGKLLQQVGVGDIPRVAAAPLVPDSGSQKPHACHLGYTGCLKHT